MCEDDDPIVSKEEKKLEEEEPETKDDEPEPKVAAFSEEGIALIYLNAAKDGYVGPGQNGMRANLKKIGKCKAQQRAKDRKLLFK